MTSIGHKIYENTIWNMSIAKVLLLSLLLLLLLLGLFIWFPGVTFDDFLTTPCPAWQVGQPMKVALPPRPWLEATEGTVQGSMRPHVDPPPTPSTAKMQHGFDDKQW